MLTKAEIKAKYYNKIYIIESPNREDIVVKRNEGDALNAALSLACLDSKYYRVSSQPELAKCFDDVAEDIIETRGNRIPVPFIHFSLHGDESGIVLTNGDFILWNDLREGLMILNHKVKFVNSFGKFGSRFSLSMSVCKGINAKNMYVPSEKLNPFGVLVGPSENIDWSDSLVAYITYYHNLIYKRIFLKEAVLRMNKAAGLENTFEIFLENNLILQ